jgi:hypothetical protein
VEQRLILPEAQAPQPDHDVHDDAPTDGCRSSWSCPQGLSSWGAMQPNLQLRASGSPTGRLDRAAMLMRAPQGGRLSTGRSQPLILMGLTN